MSPKPSASATATGAIRRYKTRGSRSRTSSCLLCNVTEQEIREQFFRTRDAAAALASRTERVDELVVNRWQSMPPGIALAAVGGYGRRELFPFSDIDLLILTPDEKTQLAIKEPLSLFLRDLWDEGLRISQSVHTPRDCNQIDAANAELAVSLLDRRFLAGDEALFRQIHDPRPDLGRNIVTADERAPRATFRTPFTIWNRTSRTRPAGCAICRCCAGWPSSVRAIRMPGRRRLLFEIRCFLHYLAGRDDNKLNFERQDEIALLSGAVSPEDLMRHYYRAVRDIARLASRRLERFEAKRSSLFSQFRDRSSRFSNADFSVVHGAVLFRDSHAIENDPGLILRLFTFIGRHGLPLATDAEERVERAAGLFRDWVAAHQPIWPQFREILRLPHGVKALRAMHETGALAAVFPELREIEALVIRDFYHRYTVDEHTLVAIESILGLRERPGDPFGDVALETPDLDLLITALLFHDAGKGTPDEGHVAASRRIAAIALRRSGISDRALDVVDFLIAAHLEMSAAMNGRDLSDPATTKDMAAKVGTVERLKLLTLLTFGDISAVHPTAMTPWRRQLLWNLYTETYAELTRELTARTPRCRTCRANPDMRHFLEGLPPRYLRTHTDEECRRIFGWSAKAKSAARPLAGEIGGVGSDRRGRRPPVSVRLDCRRRFPVLASIF